jgi:hypothetical protein
MRTTGTKNPYSEFPPAWKLEVIKLIDDRISSHHVTREDFTELKTIVAELAKAQKRTEQRVEELAQAQKQTEKRMEELAQAQTQTEKRMEKLVRGLKVTRQQLGGLSDDFGYSLENKAIKHLPAILAKEGFIVTENLVRKYLMINGKFIEANIIGKVRKDNEEFILIGEAKSRLQIKKIEKFITNCKIIGGKQIRILISHLLPPAFEDVLKENNIRFIPSYLVE